MKYRKLMIMVILAVVMAFAFSCKPPADDDPVTTDTGGGGGGTADTTAPTVSSSSPSNNSTNFTVGNNITVTFSEALKSSTVSTSSVTMVDNSSNNIAGAVSLSGATITFNPNSDLSTDKTFTLTATTAIQDVAGNALASNYTLSFSTPASGSDTTRPTVSSTVPANNATNITITDNIVVNFSEAMTSSTINTTNITLTNSGSNVTSAVSYSSNAATINPNANLNNNTTYVINVGTGVQDAAGNALASAFTASFTTASGGGGGGGASVAAHLTPQSRISAGYDGMAYILDNGSVIQWGYYTDEAAARSTKIVDNLTNARQVAIHGTTSTGGVHACVIKTDNTSVCWGENSASQLADNTSTDCGVGSNSTTPKWRKTACAVPIFDDNTAQGNLKEVVAGWKATLWLDNNGKVYSAGECSDGKLGNGCTDNNTKTATTVMTGVKDIDMMNSIACAHKTDNSLWCWGSNSSNYITNDNTSNIQTPIQIATNVDHFDVGNVHIAMVHDNNTVFCTDAWKHSSALCADKFASYTAVKGVYASSITGLLLDNGSQVAYGYDYNGALSDKTGNSPQNNYTVQHGWIQEDGAQTLTDNFTHMDEGNSTVFGIMDNGSVVGVGGNNHGQMGGSPDQLTCYWNGSASTPCSDSSQVNDVFIYLGLDPTGPAY